MLRCCWRERRPRRSPSINACSRGCAPALGRGVEHGVEMLSAKPPWRGMGGRGGSASSFFNKRSCFHVQDFQATLLLLAGLGGEGEEVGAEFPVLLSRSVRLGRDRRWELTGSGTAHGGSPNPTLQAVASAAGGVGGRWARCDPWRALSRLNSSQIRPYNVAGVDLLSLFRYSAPLLVLAGHGGEGNELGVTVSWEVGGSSESTMVHCCQDLRSVCTRTSYKLHGYLSGCCVPDVKHADVHDADAFSMFGTCRRRVRSSLLRFLRFNSREPPDLSSVIALLDL